VTISDLIDAGRDVCSVPEAAEILDLSVGSAYAAARAGELPAIRVGRRFIVPVRRLAELLGAVSTGGSDD